MAVTEPERPEPSRRPRRPLRLLAWTLLACGGLAIAGFAGLAWAEREVARRVVEVASRRGLTVTVGDVTVPLLGGIALSDVTVATGGTTLATLPRIETDLDLVAVARGARRPERMRLVGGSVIAVLAGDGVRGWSEVLTRQAAEPVDSEGGDGEAQPVAVDLTNVTVWLEGGIASPALASALAKAGLEGLGAERGGVSFGEAVSAVVTGTIARDEARKVSGSLAATLRQGPREASLALRVAPTEIAVEVAAGAPALALRVGGGQAALELGSVSIGWEDGEAGRTLRGHVASVAVELGGRRVGLADALVVMHAGAPQRVDLSIGGFEAQLGSVGPLGGIEARIGSVRVTLVDPLGRLADGDPLGAVSGLSIEGPELRILLPGASPSDVASGLPEAEVLDGTERPAEVDEPPERPGDVERPGRSPPRPEAARDTRGTFAWVDAAFERMSDVEARLKGHLEARMPLVRRIAALGPSVGGARVLLRDATGAEVLSLVVGSLRLVAEADGALRGSFSAEVRRGSAEAAHVGVDLAITGAGRLDAARLRLKGTEVAGRVAALVPQLRVEPETAVDLDVTWTPPPAAGSPHHVVGTFAFSELTFHHWRISDSDIADLQGTIDFEAVMDPDRRHLVLNLPTVAVGEATLEGQVDIRKRAGDKPAFRFRLAMPNQDCGAAARAIPRSLLPNLSTLALRGEATFDARLDVDLARPRELKLNVEGDLARCEVLSLGPGIDPLDLRGDYLHHPREPERGELAHIAVGPGTASWIPSEEVPRHAKLAAEVTEDRAWREHKGVQWGLVAAALKLDLEHGRFVYGGSTITQQLVKNIYLTRKKNLGRKFEEAIIAWQMERVLTKDEIMTLYVNCIEYGPDLYGIKAAAKHYFGKRPHELDPLESAFIMGLKPYPKAGYRQWHLGTLDPWWVKRVSHVLRLMSRYGGPELTPEIAESYAPFQPNFRRPGQSRPTPRPGYPTYPADGGPAPTPSEEAAPANEAGGPTPPPEAAP